MLNTVKVPEQFEPLFQKAQDYVARFFSERKTDPSTGTIEISGERYILVRAASMSVDFFETIECMYEKEGKEEAGNIARQLLFDIAHAIGKQDARNFHKKMDLQDPIEKLSAGPVYFSHTGWAFVDILPESSPSPDDNYYLIYDHPYSFESAAWLAAGKKSDFPVCIMNAGYSSGWCEESFGLGLVATEIMCQARGDPVCRFIMAPPSRMEEHIAAYIKKEPGLAKKISGYEVPGFFKRKVAEQALRESEERFRSLFEALSDGIVMIGLDRKILMCNHPFALMHGYERPEELAGRDAMEFVAQEDQQIASEDIRLMPEKGMIKKEYIFVRKDGSLFPVEITASLVLDAQGVPCSIVGIVRDITERQQAEDEIRQLNEALGAKVQERTQQLLAAQDELVRREKLALLGQVADTVGHELRNPLGVMNNAVYFLQAVLSDSDETVREYLGIIKDEITDAERIVSDLLDAVRTKPPQPTRVEIAELLRQSLRKCPLPADVTVHMEIADALPAILVDPAQMHQVLWNLMTNAVEAMPGGGVLKIRAAADPAANTVTISIKDSGGGMTPEQLSHLFEPLFTTKARRIGLGLVVVKNLTEANGGSVVCRSGFSPTDKGTTFTVTLPTG